MARPWGKDESLAARARCLFAILVALERVAAVIPSIIAPCFEGVLV